MPPRIKTGQEMLGLKEFTELSFYRALGAEFLGTLFLVFVGCCTSISTDGIVPIALSFGLTQALVVQSMGHVSGAHINPAVSAGFLVARCISFSRFFMYVIVQVLGAIAASGILYGMIPEASRLDLGVVSKEPLMTNAQAFGMELVITFIFVFVVMGSTDERRKDITGSVALNIGLALTAVILCAGTFSGAGINPARCIAPLIVMSGQNEIEEIWKYHWVYWIGPILGGVLASLVYSYCYRETKKRDGRDDDSDTESIASPIAGQQNLAASATPKYPTNEPAYPIATTSANYNTQKRQRGNGPPPRGNPMYPGARGGRGRPMDNRGYMSDDNRFNMHH